MKRVLVTGFSELSGWRKSSYSSAGCSCVEWRMPSMNVIEVRDSKNPDRATLSFGSGQWQAFVDTVKAGSLGPQQ